MEEVRQFVPVSVSSDFNSLLPHIANAERDYLIPVIGREMYDQLQSFYDNGSVSSDSSSSTSTESTKKIGELLLLAQSAVLHIAFWIGYDLINSYITDDGFKRVESEKVKSLFKYQDNSLKSYFRTNGFNGIDAILQYLEEDIDYFPKFKSSMQYTVQQSSFIPNTLTFNGIVYINNSRLTFLRMKPHLQLVEEIDIAPLLGDITLAELKDEMLKDSPSATKMAILPYIRKALAFLASALLMEESGADLTDNGLYFTSTAATTSNDTENKPSGSDRVAILVKRNRNIGNSYLDQIRSYLVAHAADWTDVAPSTGKVLRRDNTDKKTFWS
ncbi:MAG: DUF6712 family protein [Chloroflexota bacterium]